MTLYQHLPTRGSEYYGPAALEMRVEALETRLNQKSARGEVKD
jgi:hypothetical protein